VVFLDSDDELLPGALETIDGRIRQASEEIARLFLLCRLDRGGTSPCVPLTEGLQDYEGVCPVVLQCARSDGSA
jgi:hypothetical protein